MSALLVEHTGIYIYRQNIPGLSATVYHVAHRLYIFTTALFHSLSSTTVFMVTTPNTTPLLPNPQHVLILHLPVLSTFLTDLSPQLQAQ